MYKRIFSPVILLGGLLFAGCQTAYQFKVDAINNPQEPSSGSAYLLVPADPDQSPTDLRFKETAHYAEAALAGHGYYRVDDASAADLIVAVDSAVGEPETESRRRTEPVYAEAGGYYRRVVRPVKDKEGNVRYLSSVIWQPPYNRFIGTYDTTDTVTVYQKRLSLTAFAKGEGDTDRLPQLWSVVVENRDNSSDLRAYLPMLSAVAADYIDTDTGKQVVVRMSEDDPRLEVIRENLNELPR